MNPVVMRPDINIDRPDVNANQQVRQPQEQEVQGPGMAEIKHDFRNLTTNSSFFLEYIEWLDLLPGSNIIVLPDLYHYYYDSEDLEEVETVINLKPLNSEKRLDKFLESIASSLPSNGNLVGCFVDHIKSNGKPVKTQSGRNHNLAHADLIENGIISSYRVFNRIISLVDSRIFRNLTEKDVRSLLNSSGFIVKNITEKNGIYYFHAVTKQKPG